MDVAAVTDGTPAVGQSTSLASAYISGMVTALRSYRPDLGVEQTETLLRANATSALGGPMLNAAAAFRAAGLGALVDAYRPLSPAPRSTQPFHELNNVLFPCPPSRSVKFNYAMSTLTLPMTNSLSAPDSALSNTPC